MQTPQEILTTFVMLWAVIDPIGTVPVFIASTRDAEAHEQRRIARIAAITAAGILLFFIIAGELLLVAMDVSLLSFQIAGGIVLFLFALTMIFGESKQEGEIRSVRSATDKAIFPLATPSLASPGAMMAAVLLTENHRYSILHQVVTAVIMLAVLLSAYLFMLGAERISKLIGDGGASIVSRVMGMILASIATGNVLAGVKDFFQQ
ncbi:MarC family protein [Stratiformator vulcanicus]|uniref:UPF0056 membrane protein n=1 Tax=Stratiformator vulcanicus TaxID=2527980 RepID=A0A517R726_9PLAN|nr:MarC family protein [Stratiformator vulcanicus]QDT39694.1 hypothetical protein Pan189_41030 [Stratiformator vulcanicus]